VKNFGAPHRHDLVPGPGRCSGALTVRPLAGRAGLRLEGEADLTGQRQLREALAALPPAAEIHLDLASLDFIDIAATRQLIALTQQLPYPRLILHDPPPALIRLTRLLWPDANVEFCLSPGKIAGHDGEAPGRRRKPSQTAGFVSHVLLRPLARSPR
jgi:anti-anti-sigma regulatory factor